MPINSNEKAEDVAFVQIKNVIKGTEMHTVQQVSQKIMDFILGFPGARAVLKDDDLVIISLVMDMVSGKFMDFLAKRDGGVEAFMRGNIGIAELQAIGKDFEPMVAEMKEEILGMVNAGMVLRLKKIFENVTEEQVEEAVRKAEKAYQPDQSTMNDEDILRVYYHKYVAPTKKFKDEHEEALARVAYIDQNISNTVFIAWVRDYMTFLVDVTQGKVKNVFADPSAEETKADTWTSNIITACFMESHKTPGRIYGDMKRWFDGVSIFA